MLDQRILVLTDNRFLCNALRKIVDALDLSDVGFDYRYSSANRDFTPTPEYSPIDVKTEFRSIIETYYLVMLFHRRGRHQDPCTASPREGRFLRELVDSGGTRTRGVGARWAWLIVACLDAGVRFLASRKG